jgi:hypothetical protein
MYKVLMRKLEGKRSHGRPSSRWEDNTGMEFREIGWEGTQLIHLDQDRDQWSDLVNTVMNLRVP